MLIALGDIYAQAHRRPQVAELMRSTQERVREQDGCEEYSFAEVIDDPGHFIVAQQWRDRASLNEHYRSDAFGRYQAEIGQYLVRNSELRVHEVSASLRPLASSPLGPAQDD
jgi:quinol monooxygenase YgiN